MPPAGSAPPVEPRTTSRCGTTYGLPGVRSPSIRRISASRVWSASAGRSGATVVRLGVTYSPSTMPSQPSTATSSGTRTPAPLQRPDRADRHQVAGADQGVDVGRAVQHLAGTPASPDSRVNRSPGATPPGGSSQPVRGQRRRRSRRGAPRRARPAGRAARRGSRSAAGPAPPGGRRRRGRARGCRSRRSRRCCRAGTAPACTIATSWLRAARCSGFEGERAEDDAVDAVPGVAVGRLQLLLDPARGLVDQQP